ncbi:sodium:solute symporter [bacterium]|nr:sodium:solute symporter [bacterium]
MIHFNWLDWFWVIAYIVLMVATGVLFHRLASRGEADFFLADRDLPWWLPATSVYATHTATDTPIWMGGVIYRYGLSGIWYSFFCAWCAVSAFVSTRIFRRSVAYTQAEWQSLRFSGLGAELLRGWLAGWQVFMNMFILGWVGIAMGRVFHFLFPIYPDWVGMILFSGICAVYVLFSGYWGVVMADFQQGVIAFGVILIVSAWEIWAAGGPSGIMDKLAALGQSWRADPFHFTGWWSGDFPIAWFVTMILVALLGGLGMGTNLDWYVEAQRIQSARTVRDASYSIWTGTALVLTRNALWAPAILGFYVLFPAVADPTQYEMAWYVFGFKVLPAGMVGFFFAAILAIHFSSVATLLNLGAMYYTRDIYHHYLNPRASEKRLVWIGRVSTLAILVGSFFYGMMMENITRWLIFALWIMAAGSWLPSILQVVWWRFNSWGFLASWLANLLLSWLVVWVLPAYGILPELLDYQQFWLLLGLGLLIYLPVTYLTPPDDMKRLVRFYVMSRPIGWWGPVHREAVRLGMLHPETGAALQTAENNG